MLEDWENGNPAGTGTGIFLALFSLSIKERGLGARDVHATDVHSNNIYTMRILICIFPQTENMEDQVLSKAQRGLFFGKPKFGIFINAWYKKDLNVDDPAVRDGVVSGVRDVVNYALKIEQDGGNSKEDKSELCTLGFLFGILERVGTETSVSVSRGR